jgi:hypothetical protein
MFARFPIVGPGFAPWTERRSADPHALDVMDARILSRRRLLIAVPVALGIVSALDGVAQRWPIAVSLG